MINIFFRLMKKKFLGTVFNKHTMLFLVFNGKVIYVLWISKFCAFLVIRLPLSMGLILYLLLFQDEHSNSNLYCQILRDTESLSLVTTNIWAIVSIMFRYCVFSFQFCIISSFQIHSCKVCRSRYCHQRKNISTVWEAVLHCSCWRNFDGIWYSVE